MFRIWRIRGEILGFINKIFNIWVRCGLKCLIMKTVWRTKLDRRNEFAALDEGRKPNHQIYRLAGSFNLEEMLANLIVQRVGVFAYG